MPSDSDVALVGTGVAPLIAARHLMALGKSVLVLNPERDFFLEDSELPLDPLVCGPVDSARLARSSPVRALAELQPEFPGAVESWPLVEGFHDPLAPHVRARSGLWIAADGSYGAEYDRLVDRRYVEASDAEMNPQLLEGSAASKRFPGAGPRSGDPDTRGLLVSRLCDVDVARYRNGVLEFVRERLGPEQLVTDVLQLDLMPGGARFHARGSPRTARLREGMLVFWTPRLTQWVMNQARRAAVRALAPKGVRTWEEWTIVSRDAVDPSVIGIYGDLAVLAEAQGAPQPGIHRLTAYRPGPLRELSAMLEPSWGQDWATSESFDRLSSLCSGFLRWEKFSIRAMRPRVLFDWAGAEEAGRWELSPEFGRARVVGGCDGALVDVVRHARAACDIFEGVA